MKDDLKKFAEEVTGRFINEFMELVFFQNMSETDVHKLVLGDIISLYVYNANPGWYHFNENTKTPDGTNGNVRYRILGKYSKSILEKEYPSEDFFWSFFTTNFLYDIMKSDPLKFSPDRYFNKMGKMQDFRGTVNKDLFNLNIERNFHTELTFELCKSLNTINQFYIARAEKNKSINNIPEKSIVSENDLTKSLSNANPLIFKRIVSYLDVIIDDTTEKVCGIENDPEFIQDGQKIYPYGAFDNPYQLMFNFNSNTEKSKDTKPIAERINYFQGLPYADNSLKDFVSYLKKHIKFASGIKDELNYLYDNLIKYHIENDKKAFHRFVFSSLIVSNAFFEINKIPDERIRRRLNKLKDETMKVIYEHICSIKSKCNSQQCEILSERLNGLFSTMHSEMSDVLNEIQNEPASEIVDTVYISVDEHRIRPNYNRFIDFENQYKKATELLRYGFSLTPTQMSERYKKELRRYCQVHSLHPLVVPSFEYLCFGKREWLMMYEVSQLRSVSMLKCRKTIVKRTAELLTRSPGTYGSLFYGSSQVNELTGCVKDDVLKFVSISSVIEKIVNRLITVVDDKEAFFNESMLLFHYPEMMDIKSTMEYSNVFNVHVCKWIQGYNYNISNNSADLLREALNSFPYNYALLEALENHDKSVFESKMGLSRPLYNEYEYCPFQKK